MNWRALFRRTLYFTLVFLTTLLAIGLLAMVFQKDGGLTPLEVVMVFFYAILFTWISFSFWSAFFGFILVLTGKDKLAISQTISNQGPSDTPLSKTAIVMPVYNEDTVRIFAGIKAMYRSLADTGLERFFDFHVLSDTRDAATWVTEEVAWLALSQELRGKVNIYYRNRVKNTSRKSGNIADFCRHWGSHYRYFIVADADSVMSGETLVKLVRMMDMNPKVALIQTPPLPVNRESLFSRILQFASSVYGPIFTSGLAYWHMGDGNYWGHNAIIRTEAWLKHCGLPKLPGKEPFGGEILSHDFVEAALLKKAGWQSWLAYDLEGSYEEIPPTIIDYAKRDRRWCQGNMQHSKLLLAKGLPRLNKLHLTMGIMSYLASPLWLLFLIITGVEAYFQTLREPEYFFGDNLFPVWPVSYAVEMTTVLAVTLTMLFLPKIWALFVLMLDPPRLRRFGGLFKASLSVLLETIYSVLLAPIMMLFQSKFVMAILLRRNVGWPPQTREDHATGLGEALLAHGGHIIIGALSAFLAYNYVPAFFYWLIPVPLGLLLSIPLSMLTSRVSAGLKAREWGLFVTPEELTPPPVIAYLRQEVRSEALNSLLKENGFQRAIVDPTVNALHISLLPSPTQSKRQRFYLESLIFKLVEDGAESLSATEKRELLSDRDTMNRLHILAWSEPELMRNPYFKNFSN